jgi:hypothetical protein
VITNDSSSESLSWSASTAEPLAVAGSTSGTLAPGASVTISVNFTCSQATSFTGALDVSVTQAGVTTQQSLSVAGNVG